MSVNTVLESIYYAVNIVVALWGAAYGLWKSHKAKDDDRKRQKGQ